MKKRPLALSVLLTLLAAGLLAALGVVAVAYSGAVDIAAAHRPPKLVRWLFATTRDHAIARRSKHIEVPSLDASDMLELGADHYKEMCVGCHGAPGVEPGEAAQGLEPPAPKLYRGRPMTVQDAAETFWVVKNGIQMTGMPAIGKTHDDKKIWAIVAFVKRLHDMTPAEYTKFVGVDGSEAGHHHGEEEGHEHEGAHRPNGD